MDDYSLTLITCSFLLKFERKLTAKITGPGGRLRTYLEKLATAENIQEFVDQHPFGQRPITERSASWEFYLRVLDTVYSVETNHITCNSTCKL